MGCLGARQGLRTALVLVVGAGISGCSAPPSVAPASVIPRVAPELADEPIQPLPPAPDVDIAAARVGARLFNDARLSSDGSVSCASCHPLDRGAADGQVHSRGAQGKLTALNTPTLFNVVFNFRFNWAGSFTSLEEELDAPVTRSMRTTISDVLTRVRGDAEYQRVFAAAFPDGITEANLRHAIAEYERTLVTPNARFDRYLRGDAAALSDDEKKGYALFKDLGCASCHQGANAGGNMFQRMGVLRDAFAGGKERAPAELGRFQDTHSEQDRYVFRVPQLRNVALTAPYFHDGSAVTLPDAVVEMGRVQLGRAISREDATLVAAFLGTLTGEFHPTVTP